MSSKLLLDALAGRQTTRPPFWFMRQAGRYLAEYRAVRQQAGSFLDLCYNPELATEVTLQPIRRFAMDAAILFADILVVPDALGQPLDYREGEGPVLEPVRTTDAVRRLGLGDLHHRLAPIYRTIANLRRELPAEVTLIGFAGAPWTVATYMVEGGGSADHAWVKKWAYADPDGFAVLIDLLVEATSEYLLAQIEAGAEVVQIFDTWAGVLPESGFRRWCVEPTAAIVARIREKYPAVPVIGFPRGAGAGYQAYAAETGINAVGLDTAVPLGWARDSLQPRVAVQGNLDPLLLVIGGTAMEREARRILDQLAGGPFIFNLGHGIVPQTPPEHVEALSSMLRGWRTGSSAGG